MQKNFIVFLFSLIICISVYIGCGFLIKETESKGPSSSNISASTSLPTTANSSITEFENGPVNVSAEASLKQLFSDTIPTEYSGLSVSYDDINSCYSVSYSPTEDFFDETTFVRECLNDYIKYCTKSYLINNVSSVQFIISMDIVDAKGSSETAEVFQIRCNKDKFSTYNWDNLEYIDIYDTFTQDCDFFWIHPGIFQEVDTAEVYYNP